MPDLLSVVVSPRESDGELGDASHLLARSFNAGVFALSAGYGRPTDFGGVCCPYVLSVGETADAR